MATISADDLKRAANTIRGLAMDGVQKANSGHPGMPMGMADVAAVLWLKHLQFDASRPDWGNRDRFVLSAGHGSMLLYSLLHLAGFELPMEQLQQFRQWESMTPGHPEHGDTPGVETTTGPLGQGCGNAVGMALAEAMLAARFNSEAYAPIDHHTYVIAGDGDLMEGVSHEAFSLAGHLGLNKLVVFYDSNRITIEGETDLAYSDNVKKRFEGYNWRVLEIDAHDVDAIDKAIRKAKREKDKPVIIICNSKIGFGSPNKEGSEKAHGEPLGVDEIVLAKRRLGLPEDESFHVLDGVYDLFTSAAKSGKRRANKWLRELKQHREADTDFAARWRDHFEAPLPDDLAASLPAFDVTKPVATRASSGKVIQALAAALPNFVGGSADLAPSTKTLIEGADDVSRRNFGGRNFRFGVREHGMGALLNGFMLHGGFRAFGATFFVFADYFRPSIRLAAIMHLPVIYVMTHDSFCVGEDGPTHEPVEQLTSLRCMPNLTLIRPADATESAAAWIAALENSRGPTALLLTRQTLPVIDREVYPAASHVSRGAYTLWQNGDGIPEVILIGTGSEVDLALQAGKQLAATANVRVVSMPSWELFEQQPDAYRADILPPACRKRVAIEAAAPQGWERYVGDEGRTICMTRYGASAPYQLLGEKFGFTVENVVAVVKSMGVGRD